MLINFFYKLYHLFKPHLHLYSGSCRFTPTCSLYARQALNKYGLFYGGFLSLKRVLKCHPFSKGGYDPLL